MGASGSRGATGATGAEGPAGTLTYVWNSSTTIGGVADGTTSLPAATDIAFTSMTFTGNLQSSCGSSPAADVVVKTPSSGDEIVVLDSVNGPQTSSLSSIPNTSPGPLEMSFVPVNCPSGVPVSFEIDFSVTPATRAYS